MMKQLAAHCRRHAAAVTLGLAAACAATPIAAQGIQTVDPDAVIDGDLAQPQPAPEAPAQTPQGNDADSGYYVPYEDPALDQPSTVDQDATQTGPQIAYADTAPGAAPAAQQPAAQDESTTYKKDDLIGAAEGLFGKGAKGLAGIIEDILAKQGEPNGYIVGREAGAAFIFGARYGSGTLYHKVEGEMPVYWTGPSIGFDAGANAGNTFVLVYNLYDTEELYERYPAGEGQAYLVGGFNASYLRKGDVVLIPVRVGAGLRLGINAGYMKFSKKQRWLPF